jgi:hypothetical protein
VWWLAGIIGLEKGLVIYIKKLHERTVTRNEQATQESGHPDISPDNIIQFEKAVSPTPRDIQGDPRLRSEECWVHPK